MPRQKRIYTHWTADTELAFLLALRLTGSAKKAAVEIGRSFVGAYKRRERLPDFAAKWEAEIDRWRVANAADYRAEHARDPGLMPNQVRYDGFTPIRQRAFLRMLTETGNVEETCKRIGISQAAAYKARRTFRSFSDAWDRAETHCEADLEQIAIERAIDGIEQEVAVGGRMLKRTVYPEGLMRTMLGVRERRSRDAARVAEKGLVRAQPRATKEETDAILLKRLAAIDAQKARQKADAEARIWAAWQATWGSFGHGGLHLGEVEQEVLPPLTLEEEEELDLQQV